MTSQSRHFGALLAILALVCVCLCRAQVQFQPFAHTGAFNHHLNTLQFHPLHHQHQHQFATFQFGPVPPGFNPFQPNPGFANNNANVNPNFVNNNNVVNTGAVNTGANNGANPLTGDTVDGLANSLSLIVGRLSQLSNDPNFLSNSPLPNPNNILPPGAAPPGVNPAGNPNTANNVAANNELASINNQLRDIIGRLSTTTTGTTTGSAPVGASTPAPTTASTGVAIPVPTTSNLAGTSLNAASVATTQPHVNTPTPTTLTTAPVINNNNVVDHNLNPVVASSQPTGDLSSSLIGLSTSISRNLANNRV